MDQGAAYPPQQGYPPAQPGYPPQQGYPPPQPGYPPQQTGGYTPPQNYTDVPPPYEGAPPVQKQQHTNVVVVQQPIATVITSRIVSDNYFTLSIILTVVCFFCGFYTLLCTIPAIFFAISAREAEQRGDIVSQRSHARTALGLDIAACVSWGVTFMIWIILGAAR